MQTNNYGCWFNTVEHTVKWSSYQLQRPLYHFQPRGQGHAEVCGRNQWAGDNKYFDRCFFTIIYHYDVLLWKCHSRIDIWYTFWIPKMTLKMGKKSFELLPNENFPQFRVANPGSSSSSDSSLKLRFLFAQSLDISCKTGRRIFFCPLLLPVNLWSCQIIFLFSLPGQINGFSFFNHL